MAPTLAVAKAAAEREDWHLILELPRGANVAQIQKARRQLQRGAHEDKGGSRELSTLINVAADKLLHSQTQKASWNTRDDYDTLMRKMREEHEQRMGEIRRRRQEDQQRRDQQRREEYQRRREDDQRRREEDQRRREEDLRKQQEDLRKRQEDVRKHQEDLRKHQEDQRRREEYQRKRQEDLQKREEGLQKREEDRRRREEGLENAMRLSSRKGACSRVRFRLSTHTGNAFPAVQARLMGLYQMRAKTGAKTAYRALIYAAESEIIARRCVRETTFPKTARMSQRDPLKAKRLVALKLQYNKAYQRLRYLTKHGQPSLHILLSTRRLLGEAWATLLAIPAPFDPRRDGRTGGQMLDRHRFPMQRTVTWLGVVALTAPLRWDRFF